MRDWVYRLVAIAIVAAVIWYVGRVFGGYEAPNWEFQTWFGLSLIFAGLFSLPMLMGLFVSGQRWLALRSILEIAAMLALGAGLAGLLRSFLWSLVVFTTFVVLAHRWEFRRLAQIMGSHLSPTR